MTTKLNCKVIDGLMPSEKIAVIQSADGWSHEVIVSAQSITGNQLMTSEIGRRNDQVLVELPRESTSGRWRLWVNASSIGG